MSGETLFSQPHQLDQCGPRLVLIVPRAHVKIVKSALELHKKFDRYHGISPEARDETSFQHAVQNGEIREQRMCIPTTIAAVIADGDVGLESKKHTLLTELQLNRLSPDITLSFWTPPKSTNPVAVEHNPLRKALRDSLEGVQLCALASSNRPLLTVDLLVSSFPESYSVYKPLLLLPSHSLGAIWNTLLSEHGELFQPTWKHVAAALHCTHIALNSPIPPSNTADSAHANDNSNILRSPVNLTPIHGNFGPAPTPLTLSTPTTKDFDETLWVCTIQNGIHQTWAPLYTMFSRGNVKESPNTPPANRGISYKDSKRRNCGGYVRRNRLLLILISKSRHQDTSLLGAESLERRRHASRCVAERLDKSRLHAHTCSLPGGLG